MRCQIEHPLPHQVDHLRLKSKLYHIFIQKINGFNYNLFCNVPHNQRQYKHYKDYKAYLQDVGKHWSKNYNKNWIELKYFRTPDIKNSDIENKFNHKRVTKQFVLHIKTPYNHKI